MHKENVMKVILWSLLIALLSQHHAFAQTFGSLMPVDEKLTKAQDLTGDGKPDKIILTLKAANNISPMTWNPIIESGGQSVYSYESDDSWLDKFFGEEGYMDRCSGYSQCKARYYYNDIINYLVVPYKMMDVERIASDESLIEITLQSLKGIKNLPENESIAIIRKIQKRLIDRSAIVISIPKSPVKRNGLMVYCPELATFVTIYEE